MISIPQNPNGAATTANSQPVNIASDQTVSVSITTSALPTGSATSANQTTGNTSLASIDSKLTNPLPVSNASLPLPAGASTSALQTTGNTSVASIDTKFPAQGQALSAASIPVVLPAAQITSLTPPSNAGYALDTSVNSLLKPASTLAAVTTVTTVSAVTAITNALPTGANTIGNVNAIQSGTWNVTNISGTVSLPTGASTSALQTTGNTSLSNIDTTTAKLPIAQGATLGANFGAMSMGSVSTSAPTYTTGQISPLSLDLTGALRVNITSTPTANNNITQFGGVNLSTGTGASGTGIPRVTVANDSNILATQSGVWNVTNISGTVSLPTGASTSALQTTGNTSLASIDTKFPAQGQALITTSIPVVLPAAQITSLTPPSNTGYALDTSVNLLLKPASTLAAVTLVSTVSAVTAITNALPTGTNTIGNVNQTLATAGFNRVTDGTNTGTVKAASTAPVATDTALVVALSPNSPASALPTGASTSANQTTLGSQTTKINDGTNTGTVKAASTAAVATDTAFVVALSPNNNTLVNSLITRVSDGTTVATVKAANATPIAGDNALVVALQLAQSGGLVTAVTGSSVLTAGNRNSALVDLYGGLEVGGHVGTGNTDVGNPVKIGGVFNTTQPTVTTGQRVDAQSTARGAQIVATGVEAFNVASLQVIDTNNTSVVALAGGGAAVFTGAATSVLGYSQINIVTSQTGSTTPASMFADFSTTNTFPSGVTTISIPFFVQQGTTVFLPRLLAAGLGTFFRVRYLNDGGNSANSNGANGPAVTAGTAVAQTTFSLQTQLLPVATKELTVGLEASISAYDPAIVVRNIPNDGLRFTYSASYATQTAAQIHATGGVDIFTIAGSATKTIRITRISFSGGAAANLQTVLQLTKRSTAATGGTSAAITNVPHDTNNVSALTIPTASVLRYSVAPTNGTAVGTILSQAVAFATVPAAGGFASPTFFEWTADRPAQAIVLRGTAQQLGLSLITSAAGILPQFDIEWIEDNS